MNSWKNALSMTKKQEAIFLNNSSICSKLAICIVEPRKHPNLGPVLWQIAKIYPEGVSLHVFHGLENEEYVKDICNLYTNVHYHNLGVKNLTTESYSHLLCSNEFWLNFFSEFVLIVQTDTFLLKKIEEKFFQFDYVGAPWPWNALKGVPRNYQVGNGGFSLRKLEFMLKCTKKSPKAHPEDTYFSSRAYFEGKLPNIEIAKQFSVEHIYYPSPIGFHQAYQFMNETQMKKILSNI
jgi:hypothetical protein